MNMQVYDIIYNYFYIMLFGLEVPFWHLSGVDSPNDLNNHKFQVCPVTFKMPTEWPMSLAITRFEAPVAVARILLGASLDNLYIDHVYLVQQQYKT